MTAAGALALCLAAAAFAGSGVPASVAAVEGAPFSGQVATYQSSVGGDERWIEQVFPDLLGHAADPTSLSFFGTQLSLGATRTDVALEILSSAEYRDDLVSALYERLLRRAPGAVDLSYGLALLGGGGTDEDLEAALLGSDEYYFGQGGGTIPGFLNALFEDVLGRPIDSVGVAFYGAELAGPLTRTQVAEQVLTTQEAEYQLVDGWYVRFLHRHADTTSQAYFSNVLAGGGTDEDVIAAIVGSDEYYLRLQPPATATATIDWGDGAAPSPGTISPTAVAADTYSITGTHTYAEEGSYKVTVTVDDLDGTTTIEGVATVADASLSASPVVLTLQEGRPFAEMVATLSDANTNAGASDFTATIDWGDKQAGVGAVEALGDGRFAVVGRHSYPHRGTYVVSVQIADAGGSTTSTRSTVTIVAGKPK